MDEYFLCCSAQGVQEMMNSKPLAGEAEIVYVKALLKQGQNM